jgi:hypothetical protein
MDRVERTIDLREPSQALRSRGIAAMIERTMVVRGPAGATRLDAFTYAQEPQ